MLHHIADGVILTDASGVVQLWNRTAGRITGVSAREVIGNQIDRGLPGWHDVVDRIPTDVLDDSGNSGWATLPFDIDGIELWISIARVVFSSGVVYAFHNVTIEHEFNRRQTEFSATVSHELRPRSRRCTVLR